MLRKYTYIEHIYIYILKAGFHVIADRNKVCDPAIVIAEDRTMFYVKAGFHMIADRNKVCDRLLTYFMYFNSLFVD